MNLVAIIIGLVGLGAGIWLVMWGGKKFLAAA